jgi:hypothetical protein
LVPPGTVIGDLVIAMSRSLITLDVLAQVRTDYAWQFHCGVDRLIR